MKIKKYGCLFLLLLFSGIGLNTMAQKNRKIDTIALRVKIEQEISGLPTATYAIAFKDLQTDQSFFLHPHLSFHAASTMKTPVMIEAFRQIKKGYYSLDDSLTVHTHFKSIVDNSDYALSPTDDSDTLIYHWEGEKKSIHDIIFRMITLSSNLSTNMMIEKVGAAHIMETMRKMGAKDIQVLRGVEDDKAYAKGLNNTTTAYDLMLLMEKIGRGKAVSKKASQQMTDILLQQSFKETIPALLPADVKVAHKTGSITGIQHDSGIIFLPDGRKYILVLLSKFPPEKEKQNQEILQKLSMIIYEAMQ